MTDHQLNEAAFALALIFRADPAPIDIREAEEFIRQTVHELRHTCCIDCGVDVDPRTYRCDPCLAIWEESNPLRPVINKLKDELVASYEMAAAAGELLELGEENDHNDYHEAERRLRGVREAFLAYKGDYKLTDGRIRQTLGYCMDQVRACDEKPDDSGMCRCSRYIGMWLHMAKRIQDVAVAISNDKTKEASTLKRLVVDTLSAARDAQANFLAGTVNMATGNGPNLAAEQLHYVGEWIEALIGDCEVALGDDAKEADDV